MRGECGILTGSITAIVCNPSHYTIMTPLRPSLPHRKCKQTRLQPRASHHAQQSRTEHADNKTRRKNSSPPWSPSLQQNPVNPPRQSTNHNNRYAASEGQPDSWALAWNAARASPPSPPVCVRPRRHLRLEGCGFFWFMKIGEDG